MRQELLLLPFLLLVFAYISNALWIVPCFALPQSCPTFAYRAVYTALYAHFGRVIKPQNHSCASTSWFMVYDPGI